MQEDYGLMHDKFTYYRCERCKGACEVDHDVALGVLKCCTSMTEFDFNLKHKYGYLCAGCEQVKAEEND